MLRLYSRLLQQPYHSILNWRLGLDLARLAHDPECIVYSSEDGKKGLFSDKLNLSYYHNDPITFLGSNIQVLRENDTIELFGNCYLEILETPGHNGGCLTFKAGNYLFTGDSYIPNVPVVTKLKGGDKESNKKSLQKIMDNISEDTIICPGHGDMVQIKEAKVYNG